MTAAVEDELVLAAGTLRGVPFPERVAAAAAAGFAGVGMSVRERAALRRDGWTDADLRALLADHGVRLTELEVLVGFSSTGVCTTAPLAGRPYGDREAEREAFAVADALGVRHVQAVGAFEGALEPDAAASFAALCDRAADHGLLVALEVVPCTSVPDAATGTRIVVEADRPNGGLCLDSWHHFRGARDEAQLAAVPGDRVVVVQLDDGPLVPRHPDFLVDTLHFRDLPGHGEMDLAGFLRTVWATGASAPVSVEVMSDALAAQPSAAAAASAAGATRQVLARARSAG